MPGNLALTPRNGVSHSWLKFALRAMRVVQVKVHALLLTSQNFECSNFCSFYFCMQQAHTKFTKICTIRNFPLYGIQGILVTFNEAFWASLFQAWGYNRVLLNYWWWCSSSSWTTCSVSQICLNTWQLNSLVWLTRCTLTMARLLDCGTALSG